MVRITKNEGYDELGRRLNDGRPFAYKWKWTHNGPQLQFNGSTPYFDGKKVLSIEQYSPSFVTPWTRPVDYRWTLVLSDGDIIIYAPESDEIAKLILESDLRVGKE
jgi:hypothetical protein